MLRRGVAYSACSINKFALIYQAHHPGLYSSVRVVMVGGCTGTIDITTTFHYGAASTSTSQQLRKSETGNVEEVLCAGVKGQDISLDVTKTVD
jgi:hypothetical protein